MAFANLPPAGALSLAIGDAALLKLGAREQLLVQFVPRAAKLPPAAARLTPDRQNTVTAVSAVAVHALVFVLMGVMPSERIAAAVSNDPTAGRFAMIEMKDPLLEQPKPKPDKQKKVEKIKKPEKRPPQLQPLPAPPPPPMPTLPPSLRQFVNSHARRSTGPAGNPNASATTNKVLGALGSIGPSASAQAMTNLNAVVGAPPSSGGFKVSGTIGKLPGDGLKLAGAGTGVGRVETRGAADVTQGGKLGRVTGAVGGGDVRGVVKQPPARAVEVQGELDRGEIMKVVNAHMHEVQGCYERRLIHDPSLRGKVVLEWQINEKGSVGVVRVKFSDVRDTEVSTCIQGSARLWHFPSPKGGPVTVTFPFVFSTIGL